MGGMGKMKRVFSDILIFTVLILISFNTAYAQQSINKLYELAKKEGVVVWNVAKQVEVWKPVTDAFEKRFPGIKVTPIFISSPKVPARIITEYGGGRVSMDVSNHSIASVLPLIERNLLENPDWTGLGINEKYLRLNRRTVKVHDGPWVLFYNKKLFPDGEKFRSWEDLLNPGLKRKITIRTSPVVLVAVTRSMGEERAREYIKKLGKQEVIPADTGPATQDMVARGEALIGMHDLSTLLDAMEEGRPLDVLPVSPMVTLEVMAVIFKGAPHPNAAKLLLTWLHTPEARKAIASIGFGPLSPPEASREAKILNRKGVEVLSEDTVEMAKLRERVQDEYAKLLGITPK